MIHKLRFWLGVLVLALGVWFWWVPSFRSEPRPAKDYEAALEKFAQIEKTEAALPLAPEGRSRLLVHPSRTPRVFVLLHGLTNCPEQFVPLARILFESGANVVIPRARYAGYADRLNTQQGRQNAQDLLDQAAEGLDIAAGLGDSVSLVGLSGSAVAAAWMAQHRTHLDTVLVISPFFGVAGLPPWLTDALAPIFARAPSFFIWWNPKLKEANPGPPYAYPRVGTVTLADTLQLSRNVRSGIDSNPLQCSRLIMLSSAADVAVNTGQNRQIADDWAEIAPSKVFFSEFPASDRVPHDMIDPNQPDQQVAVSYPRILELLDVKAPRPPAAAESNSAQPGQEELGVR